MSFFRPCYPLFCLLCLPVFGFPSTQPDSLRRLIRTAADESEKLTALTDLAAYYGLRSHDSTLVLVREGLSLARKLDHPEMEVQLLMIWGNWRHNQGRYDQAKALHRQALEIARREQLAEPLPAVYQNLGLVFQRTYQQDSAYYFLLKAERAYREQGLPYEAWKTYKSLFDFFAEKGDTAQARLYGEKAFAMVDEKGSRMDRGFLLFQLLHFSFRNRQFEQMAAYQDKWAAYRRASKTSQELMESPEHIALYTFGREQGDEVEEQLLRAVDYFAGQDNHYRMGLCYEDLAGLYRSREAPARAAAALQTALTHYQKCGAGYRLGKVYYQLYLLNKKQEQPGKALHYLEAYRQLADSLAGVEVDKNLNQLKVQYETEQKEQALRIQRLELDQKTQQRNLLLGSSLALALLAVGIFAGLRRRLVTNRRMAQQESELQAQRIRRLEQEKQLSALHAMIEGQEKERTRIANDLHDTLGSLLASAKAQLAATEAAGTITERLLAEAGSELRRISQNLAPRTLTVLGLRGALEDLAGQLRQQGLDCRLQILGAERELPPTRSAMLFRICQELTQNVLKHAGAKRVLLQLVYQENELHLTVEDNGNGFDLNAAVQKQSLGLSSLQSRIRYLRGDLEIDTAPDRGTIATARIPLP